MKNKDPRKVYFNLSFTLLNISRLQQIEPNYLSQKAEVKQEEQVIRIWIHELVENI